jgi:hypothetical protein
MIHQHLSQIPIDYIRSYLISIGMIENKIEIIYCLVFSSLGQPIPGSSSSVCKKDFNK